MLLPGLRSGKALELAWASLIESNKDSPVSQAGSSEVTKVLQMGAELVEIELQACQADLAKDISTARPADAPEVLSAGIYAEQPAAQQGINQVGSLGVLYDIEVQLAHT